MWQTTRKSLVCLFVCTVSVFSIGLDPSPLVQTAQGTLRGSVLTTHTGSKFYSFRGVRYAEPVTGENRFKPPVPLKPWNGEYDATKDGPSCPQPTRRLGEVSEDCLFLNVYTKKLTSRQPVIVYFHTGGFIYFSGRSEWFGPQYLLNKDIVLVTTNYRLGPQGFLSTNDKVLRGNYGLKDQVAVLRWVKQNIAMFGGDPDNVTIMGYSIGATSVMLHMLSPMSRGLFHKAIAMSGSVLIPWSVNNNPLYLARELAIRIGCQQTNTSQQIYDCVKAAEAQNMAVMALQIRMWKTEPLVIFSAVVEKDYGDGEERFLTDEPLKLIKQGDIAKVPLIIGTTSDEFDYIPYFYNEKLLQEFNDNFEQVAPKLFMYESDTEQSRKISQILREFYLRNQPIDNTTLREFSKIFSDVLLFQQELVAGLLAGKSSQSVYMYLFSYVGRYSWKYIPGTKTPIGAVHHDDLMYIFYTKRRFPIFNETDPENHIINTLTTAWTEFAATGIPTLPLTHVRWTPLLPNCPKYLNINTSPQIVHGVPFLRRMELWESLFPICGTKQVYY